MEQAGRNAGEQRAQRGGGRGLPARARRQAQLHARLDQHGHRAGARARLAAWVLIYELGADQRALDARSNRMCAWTNMGIAQVPGFYCVS